MVVVDDDDDEEEEYSTIVSVEVGWFESRRGLGVVNALMIDVSWIRRMMERILDDFISFAFLEILCTIFLMVPQ